MRHTMLLLWFAVPVAAAEPFELSEAELDHVTAGTRIEVPEQVAAIDATRTTARGNVIHAAGSLEVVRATEQNVLVLRDNAQQNLGALINVNAAGAPVNVLLNLNVNINSTIGTMQQLNIQGAPAGFTVKPGGGG